jgi:hypothetical protein
MFRCAEGEQFDTKASKCIFACKTAGLFPVSDNPRKYRECVAVGSGFQLFERECPIGSKFDATKGKCVIKAGSVVLRQW